MTKVTRGEICDYIGYTRKFLDYSENEEARFVEDIWVVNAENATIECGYMPPEKFKLVVYIPDDDAMLESDFFTREKFKGKYAMMGKELSEMTLEELWELFPIFLVEHNDEWKDSYREIENFLQTILSDCHVDRISHIGSTAISGIWAKNIIDVLVEVSPGGDIGNVADIMKQNGFIVMSVDEQRISLNKGYTKDGFADKVYHIHLRYTGDNDELYFRDYLNEHPDVAKEYEALKLDLWSKYEHNRDAYTEAKTDFISKWTKEALADAVKNKAELMSRNDKR